MTYVGCVVALTLFGLLIAEGFKTGPPISEYPEICIALFPLGHDAQAKTTPAPFRIDVSDTCTTKDPVFVTISVTDNVTWFEGFIVQARPPNGDNVTYGEFGTNNDPQLQGLKCQNSPNPRVNNSLGHSQAKHYFSKKFTWTPPPSGVKGGIQFVATVVHETPDFWMNVKSPIISTPCSATDLLPRLVAVLLAAAVATYYNAVD